MSEKTQNTTCRGTTFILLPSLAVLPGHLRCSRARLLKGPTAVILRLFRKRKDPSYGWCGDRYLVGLASELTHALRGVPAFAPAQNGWTVLHWACSQGNATIIEMLVTEGAGLTAVTDVSCAALPSTLALARTLHS